MKKLHRLNTHFIILTLLIGTLSFVLQAADESVKESEINTIAIDHVWSGHRIKPFLLTRGEEQFVGYFDANRQMTVAHRTGSRPWRYFKVDSWLGWDSHNYITAELDSEGHLHVMGNMHADPIEYFRTSEPLNIRSLKRVPVMVDEKFEQRMTYPRFLLDKKNRLVAKYRDGGSGNGNEIYNIYDTKTKRWSRLHENQFLNGEGLMNGYFEGPKLGPDGNFHLIWVWRNTPNAATNHSLSYARSPDLVNWEYSNGSSLELPLTLGKAEVVDPVPPFGGMINGNVKLGFDHNAAPIISYHKYDKQGDTQMYVARLENAKWNSVQISDWKGFRWDFGGGGSLGRFQVKPNKPSMIDKNTLGVVVRRNNEVMRFVLDVKTLKTIRVEDAALYPHVLRKQTEASNKVLLETNSLALEHHVSNGKGDLSSAGGKYYLSWHSQPANRDRAHSKISLPSVLLLHEVK